MTTTTTELCAERHKLVDKELQDHKERLDGHDDDIKRLDRSDAMHTQEINNLTKSINAQTKAIWGLITIVATGLVGFFFFAVEKGVFK